MRSHRVAVGLLLLLVAGALGLGTLQDQSRDEPKPRTPRLHSASHPAERRLPELGPDRIAPHPAHYQRVEPIPPAHAEDLAQARQTESYARRGLEELTTRLHLSPHQQDRIFPLLVRSSPHYDQSLRLVGGPTAPGAALSRADAQNQIHNLLDPYQQIEHELSEAEKNLWWTDVLHRLEQDLQNSTQPGQLPAGEEEPHPPADPPQPPGHGGGNLFGP